MIEILESKNLVYSTPKRSSVLITEKDGPQEFDKALEARLVKEGIAKYAGEVATAPVGKISPDSGGNIPSKDKGADDKAEPDGGNDNSAEKPVYSTETDIAELRSLLKDCGMIFKPGMSKIKIVAMLDDYYADADDGEAPPDLKAEEPIP